ncbi:3-hydroxyacyl-[acyl-carrier-protein] dehydratase, mitochondrial [Humulus lupulus]|uniref:3-hydroxyacyl-[acyl-carrier-protein] dehydratase, mitochondrial n=1 Tax=Humulus lupulus TaxID=3486 RepID=UPI002B4068B4|nr:3-hydroxyacyl-[acyl-carrier-protein] dehydratase, mitochondrial [Humulus lupulus]XP_062082014.1 3-hydroxyacyl-[acyl-carrier-protein] dehydratase, mitochondrial [Humulus lupulus]XP_062082015.1 3-hydroxyacyl-[acyl-carrier-protein] dehydratase, mitochondrial [Humulus lupulus]
MRSLLSTRNPSWRGFSSSASCLLKVGDSLKQTRIFSNEDVVEYAKVTFDYNPVHFDSESARNAGFEDRLVHGMLVSSLFSRILSSNFPGAIHVSQSLHFKLPVYIGEVIVAEMQAFTLRRINNRYLAKFSARCFKNGDLLALDGVTVAILPTLAMAQVHPSG